MIYYLIDSNIWFPRLTFSMMALWSAVQTKGFVSWLCSAMKRLMASWRLAMLTKTPRFKPSLPTLMRHLYPLELL